MHRLLSITLLAEYLKNTSILFHKFVIITLLCALSLWSFYEVLYAAEMYPDIINHHIEDVKRDLIKIPSELWSMDDDAIGIFCTTALKEKNMRVIS